MKTPSARVSDGRTDRPSPAEARALTPRQRQVLTLVAAGHTNVQVGEQLQLAPDTVKKILATACERLGAYDRAHAVFLSIRTGQIRPDEVPDRHPPIRVKRPASGEASSLK